MTDKPDYMQMARDEYETADIIPGQSAFDRLMGSLARTLEARDTERAAHEATVERLRIAKIEADHMRETSIKNSRERNKAEAELQALRGKVASVLAQVLPGLQFNGNVPVTVELLRSLLPAPEPDPDPLVMHVARAISIRATELDAEAPDTCGRLQFIVNRDYLLAEAAIKELTRHGLSIAAIGGKHD